MTENQPLLNETAVSLLEMPPTSPVIGQRGVQNQGGFLTPYYLFDLLARQHEEELDPVGREPNRRFLRRAFHQAMRGWSDLATTTPTLPQTWKLWYETLFEVLGFRQLHQLYAPLETSRYGLVPVSHALYLEDNTDDAPFILIDLHPFGTDLDHARHPGARTRHRADDEITTEPISRAIEFVLDHNQTRWALLSNGSEVRLYRKGGSIARQYLKIDFSVLFDNDDDKEWLVFWGLFRLATFLPPETPVTESASEEQIAEQRCLLERVIEESQRQATKITNDLRENMVRAVEALLQGIIDSSRNAHHWQGSLEVKKVPSEDQLKELFKETIYFLYRLLFILYAESRDLLPVSDSEVYRETYSLEHLRSMVEHRIRPEDYDKAYYIQTLRTLFEMLRSGYPRSNPAAGDSATRTKSGAPFVIPPYNGQLFDPVRTQLLDQCYIPDYALREVIYELSLSHPRNRYERRERYSYADLGVDQLGSIYEGLLVYEPFIAEEAMVEVRIKDETRLVPREQADELELDYDHNAIKPAGSFLLRIWGGRRKGSGSYYTPQEITAFLVKDTLAPLVEPIVEGCAQRDEQGKPLRSADEILKLKICDPAMGSGAFLVQACRYLGEAYGRALVAEGRSDHERISPAELAKYKRRVAEKCIYGVDLNPLAVELAKVSLWLETLAQDRPLTFLDAHLRCGNSLIGAPLRNHEGHFDQFSVSFLPSEVYGKSSDAGSKAYGSLLTRLRNENRKQVRQLQAGQTIFSSDEERHVFAEYEQQRLQMEESDENKSLEEAVALISHKQELLQAALSGDDSTTRRFKQLCDLWCAIWYWPFDTNLLPPTTLLYIDLAGAIFLRPNLFIPQNAGDYLKLARKIADKQHFFHWELEFPEVWCDEVGDIRPEGGFDAIVGNPPWDKIKPDEREFYSNYNPTIWNYQGMARKQLITRLHADPDISSAWDYYQRNLKASLAFLLEGDLYKHQIAIVDDKQTGGDPDTFKFFTERAFQLLRKGGRAGIIVPHGIQATEGCTALRHLLLDDCGLQLLCRLDNERRIFSGVFHGQKFDLLVFAKGGPTTQIEAAFFSWEKAEVINELRSHPRYVQIEAQTWRELSTKLYTFIEFHSYREVELVSRIYTTHPRLDKYLEDTWNVVDFTSEKHMTKDSHLFRDAARLQLFGASKLPGRRWETPSEAWFDSQEDRYVKTERVANSKGQLFFPDELEEKRIKHRHEGYVLREEAGNRQALPIRADETYYPLYEGRMVHQFDHAAKAYVSGSGRGAKWRELGFDEKEIVPHYFVAASDYPIYGYRAGFCDVTGLGNERSLLAAMLPPDSPCGHTVSTVTISPGDPKAHLLWVALTNSFTADWLLRLTISNHISFFLLKSLVVPRPKVESPEAQALIQAAVNLTCITPELADLWLAVTGDKWEENRGARDVYDRAQLRAEIDARVADLYGLSELDFAYILSTFPLLDRNQRALPGEPKSFITRDLALLALFTLRGKTPPDDIVSFFAAADVDIRQQTGAIVDLRKRVEVAQQELGAIAYQPSGRERDEEEIDMADEEDDLPDFEDE